MTGTSHPFPSLRRVRPASPPSCLETAVWGPLSPLAVTLFALGQRAGPSAPFSRHQSPRQRMGLVGLSGSHIRGPGKGLPWGWGRQGSWSLCVPGTPQCSAGVHIRDPPQIQPEEGIQLNVDTLYLLRSCWPCSPSWPGPPGCFRLQTFLHVSPTWPTQAPFIRPPRPFTRPWAVSFPP